MVNLKSREFFETMQSAADKKQLFYLRSNIEIASTASVQTVTYILIIVGPLII